MPKPITTAARVPRISVIIPIYNVAEYVRACIQSVAAQTLTDLQVLMIDDGSTDRSGDIALQAAHGDPRFQLIKQDNAGLGGARNTGLSAARGEYIAFVDSDDQLMPDYLMRLWQALEETSGDWVACAVQSVNPDGSGSTHSGIHGQADLSLHGGLRRYSLESWSDVIAHFPSAWNKLYRHSLIDGLRFDEGTWFEDHGFFHRTAARTDHIIHLPDPLYIQTRGRAEQITAQDNERVFEQFDVLTIIEQQFSDPVHSHGSEAFARIASRLFFERSTIIANPERRLRFAARAQEFFSTRGLTYNTDWDADIGLSWRQEMAGTLPLSVILSWDGSDLTALSNSIEGLRHQSAPAYEVRIVCQSPKARRALKEAQLDVPSHWHIEATTQKTEGAAFNLGLAQARGTYVIFVRTGDVLTSWSLLRRTEAMIRHDADFGITPMRLLHANTDQEIPETRSHNGIHDMAFWPEGPPTPGPLEITAHQALSLEAQCSAKIFRRVFMLEQELKFSNGPRSDWALCLNAALLSRNSTYISHAGVTIAMRDHGFEHWHRPLGARALIHGHKSLLNSVERTLSAQTKARLPEGWQRKLFARAVREQVYFGAYTGRFSRLLMLLGVAWTALRLRYGAIRPAGLDPFVGPRLSRLLNPVAVIKHKLGFGGEPVDVSGGIKTTTPEALHAFNLSTQGMIALRAEFNTVPHANIFFRETPRAPALFHVSLRRKENLIVCNSQSTSGQWRKEQRCVVDLTADFSDLTITFFGSNITINLDGTDVFKFGGPTLRRNTKFKRLEHISGFDVEGVLRPLHVLPQLPHVPLILNSNLILCAQGTTPDTRLRALPSDTELQLMPALAGTSTAILPAQLWSDLPATADLTLELIQGETTSTFILTRNDLCARIEALLSLPLATTDSTLCLTLLEHIRYAGLIDQLSNAAQRRLDIIAKTFGVTDFLHTDAHTKPQRNLTQLKPDMDSIGHEVATAVARVAQSQSPHANAISPNPLDIVAALHVSPEAEVLLFLSLTEYFCSEGRDFTGLHQLAKRRGILPFEAARTRWGLSATLPYLMAEKHYAQVCQTLHMLADPNEDWLVTAGIGWTVREALISADTPAATRHDVFYAFSDLLYKRIDNYWDRVHCRELTRTVATIVLHRHRLEPYQQQHAVTLSLKVYGLSRQFWADLAESSDLPVDLINARVAFERVMNTTTPPQVRDQALRLFETAGTVDAPRVRREIFGPAGLPRLATKTRVTGPIDTPDLNEMKTTDSYSLGLDVIRHMASPNAVPVTSAVSQLATIALPTLYPKIRRAPYFETQRRLAQQAANLDVQADMTGLLDSLTQLTDAGSHYLGLGMAITLIDKLHDEDPERVQILCDWIQTQLIQLEQRATSPNWRVAPAIVQPLRRLHLRPHLLPAVQHLSDHLNVDVHSAQAADNSGLPEGNPLFDTIVTVFSCAPYLDTRIPAMRAGWLGLLEDLGVPYVIIVGDGDGTMKGDVLHLDAPDDYEGLPQKTLATIEWVHNSTRFGHMLKIDDDCFLNVPLFFEALSYRKFDYYGRRLYRAVGQMDRKWHQSKSTTLRGQLDLDKSPEPSEYTDGGTAYTLSRTAMAAALDAARSPQGRALISVSFMEDKMLGDLLAMNGIRPNEEDYRLSIRRRTYGAATPVALWQNGFHASQTAEVQLVHLDTEVDQAAALARLDTPGLWPRKIWPSYQDVKLGYQSNALELISAEASVERARSADVAVVACMRNEMFMLPHFLAHYRKLGVTAFLIADNCSDDGTLEYLEQQPDVALFSVDTDYNLSHYGVAWQQAMISTFRLGKWSLIADADELLVWQEKQTQTLSDLLRTDDFKDANAARIFMLDMYPKGPLEQADFSTKTPFEQASFADLTPFLTDTLSRGPYANQPSWTSALRHRLIAGSTPNLFVAQKLALLRYQPWMRLSAGLHFVSDVDVAPRELMFAHFKYNADFRRKAQVEVLRGQHFNDAEEYRKYLALTSEGRSVIYDPDLSAQWSDVPFVKRRLRD